MAQSGRKLDFVLMTVTSDKRQRIHTCDSNICQMRSGRFAVSLYLLAWVSLVTTVKSVWSAPCYVLFRCCHVVVDFVFIISKARFYGLYFCLYGPFNCISFHKFSRQLSVFLFCCSGLISVLLVLSTVYLVMKVSFSPDVIHRG